MGGFSTLLNTSIFFYFFFPQKFICNARFTSASPFCLILGGVERLRRWHIIVYGKIVSCLEGVGRAGQGVVVGSGRSLVGAFCCSCWMRRHWVTTLTQQANHLDFEVHVHKNAHAPANPQPTCSCSFATECHTPVRPTPREPTDRSRRTRLWRRRSSLGHQGWHPCRRTVSYAGYNTLPDRVVVLASRSRPWCKAEKVKRQHV